MSIKINIDAPSTVQLPPRPVTGLSRSSELALRRKEDGARIKKLREKDLNMSQEAFAAQLGVSRISALHWESGKTSPSAKTYQGMADLALKVAPHTALWFLEKAGIDREKLLKFIPEFEKISKAAEQRVREMAREAPSGSVRVPLLRNAANILSASFALTSPEEVERWISLPSDLISNASATVAVRISQVFVRPIFDIGDVVVIDTTQNDVLQLEGKLVVTLYIPSASTKRAAEAVLRGAQPPSRVYWPHVPEGLYLGWLGRNRESSNSHVIQLMSVNSEKYKNMGEANGFSVPLAALHNETPEWGLSYDEESRLIGRVICWMSGSEAGKNNAGGSPSQKSRTQKSGKK